MRKFKSVTLKKDLPDCKAGRTAYGDNPVYVFNYIAFGKANILSNPEFFDVEYEPERKSINVNIEYEPSKFFTSGNITAEFLQKLLVQHYYCIPIKVTELPKGESK